MTKESKPYNAYPGLGYRVLKAYVRFFHDYFYYRKVYWIDIDNIPEQGPVMLVSDHQNGLSDALGFVVSVNRAKRKLRMIARADAFKPPFGPILRWMGILPAYRSSYEDGTSVIRNRRTLEEAEEELIMGGTVGIYPESGHQDKRWLGRFSVGYLHIVFEAARRTGFEKEIFIVPSCNHYSDYLEMGEQMLIHYGKPVSAKPYYELYRTHPIEARNKFNVEIKEKVAELMLNITDLDNYDAIDYLRNTYGIEYSLRQGLNPAELPEKLASDKQFVARLDTLKLENPVIVQKIYDDALRLKEQTEAVRIKDCDFRKCHGLITMALWLIGLIALAPLFLVACVPNALIYFIPRKITSKVEDHMLHSGIHFAASALLLMPLFYLITFALVWVFFSLPIASIHLICLPLLGMFAFKYSRSFLLWIRKIRFRNLNCRGKLQDIVSLRTEIFGRLDQILD